MTYVCGHKDNEMSGIHNGKIISSEKVITWRLSNQIINNRPSGMCYTFGVLILFIQY